MIWPGFEDAIRMRETIAYGGLLIGLVGLGFEISGIVNIGKAGVSLNANEISIKVPFGPD